MTGKAIPMEVRFWPKVRQGAPDECWEWQAGRQKTGYGWFATPVGARTSQRVAAYLSGILDRIDSPLHVLHKCDNPPCCNPAHLFTGTNQDNITDRVAKGRSKGTSQCGETNGSSKLSNLEIKQIRGLYSFAQFSQSQLARRFNIQQSQVSRIVTGVRCGGVL
jgi:hypothetical protein